MPSMTVGEVPIGADTRATRVRFKRLFALKPLCAELKQKVLNEGVTGGLGPPAFSLW